MAHFAITDVGEAMTWTTPISGYNTFPNDGRVQVDVRNTNASARTTYILGRDAMSCPDGEAENWVKSVPGTNGYIIYEAGLLSRARFNDRSTGYATLYVSSSSGLLVSVHRVV